MRGILASCLDTAQREGKKAGEKHHIYGGGQSIGKSLGSSLGKGREVLPPKRKVRDVAIGD